MQLTDEKDASNVHQDRITLLVIDAHWLLLLQQSQSANVLKIYDCFDFISFRFPAFPL
ncbi:uncharacterized protein DMAD_05856 [Drosophila madeirensis]|uniref:Uncharacterized protein n=1 Tax=Drosophila madeirensis TaxID=30013 RepID=A0AAU9FPG1_DROMD